MAMNSLGENPAERLLEMGAHLGNAGQHRMAALAYATAAAGSSGASPDSRAEALFHSARHLHEAVLAVPDHPCREEDLKRARATVQKALLLVRALPDAFFRTMRLLALLEAVHITQCDFAAASKTSKHALTEMRRAAERGEVVWNWWVYFRSRQIRVAALHIRQLDDARNLAANAGAIAEKRGDAEAAAAFSLSHAHIQLASSNFTLEAALPSLQRAAAHLQTVPLSRLPEAAPLRVASLLLHGFSLLRVGHVATARQKLATYATRALNLLERGRADRVTGDGPTWVWVPAPALRVLLQHFLAGALRSQGDGGAARVHAEQALVAAGVGRDLVSAPVLRGCVSRAAGRAISVALLESAARLRLALVDFAGAAPLVRAAVRRAGSDSPIDVTQCAAYLVAAEYYALSGTFKNAQVATSYLQEIQRAGASPEARAGLGDVLQMALSYRSLLIGDAREKGTGVRNGLYVSKHALAAGLFADGVFHMRQSRVLEARECLQAVLNILQDEDGRNEQIFANALIVLSGLFLVHEQIGDAPSVMTADAAALAEASRDLITEVRAKRQNYKVLGRAHPHSAVANDALAKTKRAMDDLANRQRAFQEIELG